MTLSNPATKRTDWNPDERADSGFSPSRHFPCEVENGGGLALVKPPLRSWPGFVLVLVAVTSGCGIQIPLYRQCNHDAYCGHAYDPQDIYPDPTPHDIAGGDWIRGPLGMAEIRIHDPYRGWRPDPDEPEK